MASLWAGLATLVVSALIWVGLYAFVGYMYRHPELGVHIVGLFFLVAGSWLVLRACVELDRCE
jgi:hypothetical protein